MEHPSNRLPWDETWMKVAEVIAKSRSTCVKLQTACVVVNPEDNNIVTVGYNGTPKGHINCIDHWMNEWDAGTAPERSTPEFRALHHEWSREHELHAEMNALCRPNRPNTANCTMYTLWSPCIMCANAAVSAGITRVVWRHTYEREPSGVEFLRKDGVQLCHLE